MPDMLPLSLESLTIFYPTRKVQYWLRELVLAKQMQKLTSLRKVYLTGRRVIVDG